MTTEQTLAQRLGNEARIRELEQIIPREIVTATRLSLTVEFSSHELYLSHILLEYKERTGKEYVPPEADKICRKYGTGA